MKHAKDEKMTPMPKGMMKTPAKQASKSDKENSMSNGIDKAREKSHNEMCKAGVIYSK
jgi:hypothetical protein